jgi:NitT/TauT family transport system substrate-binding protein
MGRAISKLVIVGFILMIGLSGCETETDTITRPKTTNLPFKIGKSFWPGQYWIDIAHDKGWFKEAGLDVEVVDTAADYVGSLEDLVSGKLDANGFSLFDVMRFNVAGAELVLVINADNSNGAEAILTGAGINSLKDLKGKNISVSKGTYLEYILDEALEKAGVDKADVTISDMLPENAAAEIHKESVDAVVTYEPIVSEVLASNGIRKLFDSSEIPGISPNGAAFRRSFLDERPGDVQAYVNTWHKSTVFIRENPKEAFAIIARIYDSSPGEVQAFTQMDKTLGLRENTVAYSFGSGFESLHGAARKMNNFLIDNGVTDRQLDSTEFIDARFLRSLAESLK